MKLSTFSIMFVLIFWPHLAVAQSAPQPYAGQEVRSLKALSPEEIKAYLEGEGMGLAKVAELNHYPGPKHVLELASKLRLSAPQKQETQAAYDKMHFAALRIGKQIVENEKTLEALFAAGIIEPGRLNAIANENGKLHGELRAAHLLAHLTMRKVLTAAQIAEYDKLRGYDQSAGAEHQHGQHLH